MFPYLKIIEKNWRLGLFAGVIVTICPELASFMEELTQDPSEPKLFTILFAYFGPVYRILGISLIAYSIYLKINSNKSKKQNNNHV